MIPLGDANESLQCPGPEEAFSTMPPRKTPNGAPSSSAKSSGRTSAYNPGFEQNLIRHGVYPNGYKHLDNRASVQPDNWEAIQQRLAQPRASLSPSRFSEGAFHVYQGKADGALDEADVMANAFPILQGETELPSAFRRTFQNLEPLTDGTIVDAEPDHYVGARPEQLDTSIHEKLGPFVVPSKHTAAPIVPNNSTEAKGPSGTRTVLKLQACYDGAIGARAVQCLQSFGEPKPVYDNNAYTITSTFDGELLSMYTTHPTAPTNSRGRPEYHMNRLGSFALVGTPDVFRQGATAYRNARDWTKERRDEFINTANERARASRQETSVDSSGYSDPSTPTHMAAAPESETSADEVAADVVTETHRSKKRVKRR